ncbi:MAG: hypothetical protein K0S17_2733 [Enterobacter mori]|nr:hypothetical protein [Enterobacter mori]
MATLEMQATAELAESRRKMQAKRRIKNRIALTLSRRSSARRWASWRVSTWQNMVVNPGWRK